MNYTSYIDNIVNIFDNLELQMDEYNNELILNQSIINNIYTIRRTLELRNIFNLNYRDRYLNFQNEVFDNFQDYFENDLQDIKVTLTEEEFNNLDSVILDESILFHKDCSICLDKLQLLNNLIILKCKHIYHRDCIKSWFNQSTKCPICRDEVRK